MSLPWIRWAYLNVANIRSKANVSAEQVVQGAVKRATCVKVKTAKRKKRKNFGERENGDLVFGGKRRTSLEDAEVGEGARQVELDDVGAGLESDAGGPVGVGPPLARPFQTDAEQLGRHVQVVA